LTSAPRVPGWLRSTAVGQAQQQHAVQPQRELGRTLSEPTATPAVVRIKVRRPEHKAMAMDPRSGRNQRTGVRGEPISKSQPHILSGVELGRPHGPSQKSRTRRCHSGSGRPSNTRPSSTRFDRLKTDDLMISERQREKRGDRPRNGPERGPGRPRAVGRPKEG